MFVNFEEREKERKEKRYDKVMKKKMLEYYVIAERNLTQAE